MQKDARISTIYHIQPEKGKILHCRKCDRHDCSDSQQGMPYQFALAGGIYVDLSVSNSQDSKTFGICQDVTPVNNLMSFFFFPPVSFLFYFYLNFTASTNILLAAIFQLSSKRRRGRQVVFCLLTESPIKELQLLPNSRQTAICIQLMQRLIGKLFCEGIPKPAQQDIQAGIRQEQKKLSWF